MQLIWDAIKRTAALIASEIAVIMASGAVLEIETWKSALQTGLVAALTVWGNIGRAYYKDGKLTKSEVDDSFNQ
jgi:hypothetical protein